MSPAKQLKLLTQASNGLHAAKGFVAPGTQTAKLVDDGIEAVKRLQESVRAQATPQFPVRTTAKYAP